MALVVGRNVATVCTVDLASTKERAEGSLGIEFCRWCSSINVGLADVVQTSILNRIRAQAIIKARSTATHGVQSVHRVVSPINGVAHPRGTSPYRTRALQLGSGASHPRQGKDITLPSSSKSSSICGEASGATRRKDEEREHEHPQPSQADMACIICPPFLV